MRFHSNLAKHGFAVYDERISRRLVGVVRHALRAKDRAPVLVYIM